MIITYVLLHELKLNISVRKPAWFHNVGKLTVINRLFYRSWVYIPWQGIAEGNPPRMGEIHHHLYNNIVLQSLWYKNCPVPTKLSRFSDRSRLKVGCQSLPFRIGHLFSSISFDWTSLTSDETLRRLLKFEYFKYFNSNPLTEKILWW